MSILDLRAEKSAFDKILLGQVIAPNLRAILDEDVKVIVENLSDEEVQKVKLDPLDPLILRFKDNPIELKKPVFLREHDQNKFLNINITRTLEIRDNNKTVNAQVMSTNLEDRNDKILSGRFEYNFLKNSVFSGGWSGVFTTDVNQENKKFLLPKSNAIIINDNYLFNKISTSKENLGVLNLINLLFTIMPQKCSMEFHISIITSDAKWDFYSAEKYFNRIYSQLKQKFDYSIFLELVIWISPENHKRILISNYYIASSDKGFDLFKEDDIVVDTNDILVRRVFHDVGHPGESPYKQSLTRLRLIKKTVDNARNYSSKATQTVGKIFISSDQSNATTNRLLNNLFLK